MTFWSKKNIQKEMLLSTCSHERKAIKENRMKTWNAFQKIFFVTKGARSFLFAEKRHLILANKKKCFCISFKFGLLKHFSCFVKASVETEGRTDVELFVNNLRVA